MLSNDHPKFDLFLNPLRPAAAAVEEAGDDNNEDHDAKVDDKEEQNKLMRLMGCMCTNAMKARSEVDAKKLTATESLLTAQEKKNKLIKKHHGILLFPSSKGKRNPIVRTYMQIKRRSIL